MEAKKEYKEHKYYKIDKYIQENSNLRLAERVILGEIITVHTNLGECYKSNDAFGLMTGLNKRAVQNVLKSLKDKGYLYEPKQIRSSKVMTIRRILKPNIPFAKMMYKQQLKASEKEKERVVNVVEEDNANDKAGCSSKQSRVHISTQQGAFSDIAGCSRVHAEITLNNNKLHINNNTISTINSNSNNIDNNINNILSPKEEPKSKNKILNKDNWFDNLINRGTKVNYSPPNPTVISDISKEVSNSNVLVEENTKEPVIEGIDLSELGLKEQMQYFHDSIS